MRLRRCAVLMLEPRERLEFDLALLFEGQTGLRTEIEWFALAPHLDFEVLLNAAEYAALAGVGESQWLELSEMEARIGAAVTQALIDKGLLVADAPEHSERAQSDATLRDAFWRPLSAVAHYFSRWRDTATGEDPNLRQFRNVVELVEAYGPPPAHFHQRVPASARIALGASQDTAFDELLAQRVTCRNFDPQRALDAASFARILRRVFGAQALEELAPDACAVKKTSPSGGGLHPTEAYLLVQRVEGVATGLYHYHAGDHALEPLGTLGAGPAREMALRFVAGQAYFADAQVLIALAPRFKRTFWKYRNHPKAYRAITLDAGHLSQTLYLSAAEAGLGAFITAAINEVDIEQAFGLDALIESPLAVLGLGIRTSERTTIELDPLGRVWPR